MANVVVTLKIMPESPDTNLELIEKQALIKIKNFAGDKETKTMQEPIAFGLNALKIIFVMNESLGSPDPLVDEINQLEGINSVDVVDVRRAIG